MTLKTKNQLYSSNAERTGKTIKCAGEFCSLVNALDPERDFVSKKRSRQQSEIGNRKQNDIDDRKRAYDILKKVLTNEELRELEDNGDVTKLKIRGRLKMGSKGSCTVPKVSIERYKIEHRIQFLRLEDMNTSFDMDSEENVYCGESNWEEGIESDSSQVRVCSVCFHTYKLLTQTRCLQDLKFQKIVMNTLEDQVFGLNQIVEDGFPEKVHNPSYRRNSFMDPIADCEEEIKPSTSRDFVSNSSTLQEIGPVVGNGAPTNVKNIQKSADDKKLSIKKSPKSMKTKKPKERSVSSNPSEKKKEYIKVQRIKIDDNTELPYCVIASAESVKVTNRSSKRRNNETCNLIVCHDIFETFERMEIFFKDFLHRNKGHRILLWNYAGQAYTNFSPTQCLNNTFHSKCLEKLVEHVGTEGTNEFPTNEPYFIMGHGQGGSIACLYAKARQQPTLKGIFLVNALSYIDLHYAAVIHDCRNVFQCSPEERPDLPIYFYSRFLFSKEYLERNTTPLALNLYCAIHNPISLRGRVRLCEGVLDNVDIRGIIKDIFAPIVSLHGNDSCLVRPLHASSFLDGRESCTTVQKALFRKGGKRSVALTTNGGHELLQEKKRMISSLVELMLTGNLSELNSQIKEAKTTTCRPVVDNKENNEETKSSSWSDIISMSKSLNDRDNITNQDENSLNKEKLVRNLDEQVAKYFTPQEESPTKPKLLLDPENPSFERQKNQIYKAGPASRIYSDPGGEKKSKEYMSWRLKRNRRRLSRFQQAASIIQSALRVYMAKTMMTRLKKQTCALTIERCYRGMLGRKIFNEKMRELWAARFVQRIYRGAVGRKTSYYKRITKKSQIQLARVWRGYVARKQVMIIIMNRNVAAIYFQSLWRRYQAIQLVGIRRYRRYSAIQIQRIFRGHLGRELAEDERGKYLFSRSQNRGIELGRQMLAEHKIEATRLKSELSILSDEKEVVEKKVGTVTKEIANFEDQLLSLEKAMQEISLIEVDLKSSMFTAARAKADVSLRDKKALLDEEFSTLLLKISDRKVQLESFEEQLFRLEKTKKIKEQAVNTLERKLVSLLETQEIELQEIRSRQDASVKRMSKKTKGGTKEEEQAHHTKEHKEVNPIRLMDDQKTTQLVESTENMMKFGFSSMSMSYFTAVNMIKAMKTMTVPMVARSTPKECNGQPLQQEGSKERRTDMYMLKSEAPVSYWEVDQVVEWLQLLSLGQYEDVFRDASIDGPFLFQLTDDDLLNTLGIEHKLHRKKILFGISKLRLTQEQIERAKNDFDTDLNQVGNSPLTSLRTPLKTPFTPLSINTATSASSIGRQHAEIPPSLDDLSTWIRNHKYGMVKEALVSIPSNVFDRRSVRVPYMENMGTLYEKSLDDQLFHVNKVDEHGNTLLHIAAQNGILRIGKLLIDKGANPNHQNKQGQTPGHFAVAYQFYDFASWLFDDSGGAADDLILNSYGLGPYDGLTL